MSEELEPGVLKIFIELIEGSKKGDAPQIGNLVKESIKDYLGAGYSGKTDVEDGEKDTIPYLWLRFLRELKGKFSHKIDRQFVEPKKNEELADLASRIEKHLLRHWGPQETRFKEIAYAAYLYAHTSLQKELGDPARKIDKEYLGEPFEDKFGEPVPLTVERATSLFEEQEKIKRENEKAELAQLEDEAGTDTDEVCIGEVGSVEWERDNSSDQFNVENDGTVPELGSLPQSQTNKWKLHEGNFNSINEVYCTLNTSLGQNSGVGNPISVIAELEVRQLPAECGLMYGFQTIGLRANASDSYGFQYCSEWQNSKVVGDDCIAKLTLAGKHSTLVLSCTGGIINGGYVLGQADFFTLNPCENHCNYTTELIVEKSGMHVFHADGRQMDDENKKIIIASIIAKEISNENDGAWIAIAKKEFRLTAS